MEIFFVVFLVAATCVIYIALAASSIMWMMERIRKTKAFSERNFQKLNKAYVEGLMAGIGQGRKLEQKIRSRKEQDENFSRDCESFMEGYSGTISSDD